MLSKVLIFAFTFLTVCEVVAQQTLVADFKKADIDITIHPNDKTVDGKVEYEVAVLQKTDSLFLDAQHMTFTEVLWNGKKIKYEVTDKYLILRKKLKPSNHNTLTFKYSANPKKTMYFIGWEYEEGRKQVWTQGQGKYTSNWLPSFDDVNEKVIFNLSVWFPSGYTLVANGTLKDSIPKGEYTQWNYHMEKPMSSYLLAIAAGKYKYQQLNSGNGTPMYLYYYPDQPERFEPTYRYSKEIFDFLEAEIGVPFAWKNYKQIPVKDFMYGGMENTTATIYNDSYYIDSLSFIDRNYVNVNSHELAHQWFGDLITEANPADHWLQEGFATYYAWLADEHIFGKPYLNAELYDTAIQLKAQSDKGGGESILNKDAGSLTFYQKGGWALVALENLIGRDAFREGIKRYLMKNQYKNVTTDIFIAEMEKVSKKDLSDYLKTWLEGTEFPYEEAMALLKDEPYGLPELITEKFKDSLTAKPVEEYQNLWNTIPDEYKVKIINYRAKSLVDSFYIKSILSDKSILVHNAYVAGISQIPAYLKTTFESFLKDDSYMIKEDMLYKLWANFPEDRNTYLDETSKEYGFNDYNIRILWLALAMATPEYKTMEKHTYFEELTGYTSPKYGYDVRQKALEFINELDAYTNENLKDVVNGCLHHSWRFASFCRTLLEAQLKDEVYKERYKEILPDLNEREQQFLKSKL